MNQIYSAMDVSKQAFHQHLARKAVVNQNSLNLLAPVYKIRDKHPGMSVRHIYKKIKPEGIGRDRFESFCFKHGLKLKPKRNYRRTTNSNGGIRFDNLLESWELTGINQVFVSDLTFYQIREKTYYLTFIMDLYSRRIVGYTASKRMHTEITTLPSLRMALRLRGVNKLKGTIMHSDGGGQYYSTAFLKETGMMLNSMAKTVYENIHAERLNGTIKNQYLRYYKPRDFEELTQNLKKAVEMYNTERPHSSLNYLSPVEFESLSTEMQLIIKRKKETEKVNISNNNISLAVT
ncbi:MAG: IS3 family transposase [Bacteroidia bacterium]|nr:IS3 family transposase [Bacteroidia bacterium]